MNPPPHTCSVIVAQCKFGHCKKHQSCLMALLEQQYNAEKKAESNEETKANAENS